MEPCTTYQNTHHQLMMVIGSQQGETCWMFRFRLMSNTNDNGWVYVNELTHMLILVLTHDLLS